jgi:hypothetical protein
MTWISTVILIKFRCPLRSVKKRNSELGSSALSNQVHVGGGGGERDVDEMRLHHNSQHAGVGM